MWNERKNELYKICCRHCCFSFQHFWLFVAQRERVKLVCIHSVCLYAYTDTQVIDEWDYTAMDIKPHFHVKSLMCLSINHINKACISTHIKIHTHYKHIQPASHTHSHKHSILCGRLYLSFPFHHHHLCFSIPFSSLLSFSYVYPVMLVFKFRREKKQKNIRLKCFPHTRTQTYVCIQVKCYCSHLCLWKWNEWEEKSAYTYRVRDRVREWKWKWLRLKAKGSKKKVIHGYKFAKNKSNKCAKAKILCALLASLNLWS